MLHYLAEVQEKIDCFLVRTTGGEEDQEMKNCVVLVTRVRFAPLFCSDRDEEAQEGRMDGWGSARLPAVWRLTCSTHIPQLGGAAPAMNCVIN